MATAISWLVGTVLTFVEFGVLACSALGSPRRSRFCVRLGCASLVMLALALGLAWAIDFSALPQQATGIAWLVLLLAALAVAPVFCYRTFAPFHGSSEGDGDGGSGSDPPPPPPGPPRGGTPLPDADQARARRRDHNRPSRRGVSRRSPAVEPARPAHRQAGSQPPPSRPRSARRVYGAGGETPERGRRRVSSWAALAPGVGGLAASAGLRGRPAIPAVVIRAHGEDLRERRQRRENQVLDPDRR